MEFVLKEDLTLLPGTLEHAYAYGPWDISISHMRPVTSITVKRTDDPLELLSFHADRSDIRDGIFQWSCNPGFLFGMLVPQDLDMLITTATEAKQVLPEVEAFVLALIAS